MQVGNVLLENGCDSSFGSSSTWLDNMGGLIIGCVKNCEWSFVLLHILRFGLRNLTCLNQKVVAFYRISFLHFGHQKQVALDEGIMLVRTLTSIGGKAYAFMQVNNFWIEIAKVE